MAEKGGPKVSNGMVKSCRKGWPERIKWDGLECRKGWPPCIEWDGLEWQERVDRRYRMGWSRVAEKDGSKVSNGMV